MPSWKTPTSEEIDRTITLLARPEQQRYFFDKLENPHWVTPLEDRGFFSTPPNPTTDQEKHTIQFPPWPALQYLKRMAGIPEAQDDVLRIALKVPENDNIIVNDLVAEIATKLPAPLAAQLAPRASNWLRPRYRSMLAVHLGNLIDHLVENGEVAAAVQLANTSLAITKKETGDVRGQIDDWHYGQVLQKNLPNLTRAIGMDALTLVSDLLQKAAPPYTRGGKPTTEDGSTIWHPRIGKDEDLHGIRNLLVSATRNTAAQIAHQNPENAGAVVAALEGRPTIVFQRIALDVLRREKDAIPGLVAAHLTDHTLFANSRLQHEYQRLLHDAFTNLAPADQGRILDWVADGPPKMRHAVTGEEPTPEQAAQYRKYWERRQLTPIAAALPTAWAQRYQALTEELGVEEEEPDKLELRGATSPLTKEELAAMSPPAAMAYLSTWVPTDEFLGASRASLGLHLTSIVAEDPTRFDPALDEFRRTHPTYARAYFYGLREAVDKGRQISWQPVLDLALWIVNQPRDPQAQKDAFAEEENWTSSRSAIADLLDQALVKNFPTAQREHAWQIIATLAEDPEPTPEYEATYGPNMDAPLLAINTIRGKALEGVIKYALLIRQDDPEGKDFTGMAEVPRILEGHLRADPSIAIRTVYGRFFPWLVSLDHNWAQEHVNTIFGDARGTAAWEAYVTFCPAYDDTVGLLHDFYERAVDQLQRKKPPQPRRSRPEPDNRLGEHLIALYYRGHLLLNEGLLAHFFERAPAYSCAHAIEYAGRILYSAREAIPPDQGDRLRALWIARRQAAEAAIEEHRGELAAFGWWFSAGKLDPTWELTELRDVLRINHTVDLDHAVLERIAVLAPDHALLAVECLREIATAERQYWIILGAEKHVTAVLTAALQHDDARAGAIALIHHLGVLGYTKFRALLLQRGDGQ